MLSENLTPPHAVTSQVWILSSPAYTSLALASRDAVIVALRAASAVFPPARLHPHRHCHRWENLHETGSHFDFACLIICRKTAAHRIFSLFWTPRRAPGAFMFAETSREWSANAFSSGPCSTSCHQRQKQKWRIFMSKNQKKRRFFSFNFGGFRWVAISKKRNH